MVIREERVGGCDSLMASSRDCDTDNSSYNLPQLATDLNLFCLDNIFGAVHGRTEPGRVGPSYPLSPYKRGDNLRPARKKRRRMSTKKQRGIFSLKRLFLACGYSLAGLKAGFSQETAFRQELALLVILVPVVVWIDVSILAKSLLLASLLGVLVVELLNSAIEALTDLIAPDFHPLAKCVKDMGSAAVLLALLIAAIIWLAVLLG